MSKKNSAVIKNKEEKINHDKPVTVATKLPEFGSDPCKVSPDDLDEHVLGEVKICIKNKKFPGADVAFQHEPRMMTVARFYPMAKVGELYVDEPFFQDEIEACERKRKVMKEQNLKYLVLTPTTDLHAAMEQLGRT